MWHPQSWKALPAKQQPEYSVEEQVHAMTQELTRKCGIVSIESIRKLNDRLASVFETSGQFILHAGDCAETFESFTRERIQRDLDFLYKSAQSVPARTVCIGRICGQFAKPRSAAIECHPQHGHIPVYRGDLVNTTHANARASEPSRMLAAYEKCKTTIATVEKSPIFTSHECLLLPYESGLVRIQNDQYFLTSAHFVWIGDRTRDLDGAHIEFCRGISNPLGIKVGPSSDPAEIRKCVERLDPGNVPGRITVITRLGASNVRTKLPPLIENLRGRNVLWQSDPMHGNTVQRGSRKTRYVSTILDEISDTVLIHRQMDSRLHGLHLEATGEDVTECIGTGVEEAGLHLRYTSACDPRLNPAQTKAVIEHLSALIFSKDTPSLSDSSSNTTAGDPSHLSPSGESSDQETLSCSTVSELNVEILANQS